MARHVPKTVWTKGSSSGFMMAVPVSLLLHVILAILAGIGSCQRGDEMDLSISYVSVVQLPEGNPLAGGNTSKAVNEAPVPTPPPPQPADDSMEVPATPKPETAASTPDPAEARKRALEKAAQDKARQEALRRLAQAKPTPGVERGSGNPDAAGGNFGVKGGDPNASLEGVTYNALVRAVIESNWLPPSWTAPQKKAYACQIWLKIGFDGRVVDYRLEKKSGNVMFDQSALAAVRKTEKLPPPPDEVREYYLQRGVNLVFRPNKQMGFRPKESLSPGGGQ